MPPKRKNTLPPNAPATKKAKATDGERVTVQWAQNVEWTNLALRTLVAKPELREGLFGAPKGKRTSGVAKIHHQRALAIEIWDKNNDDQTTRQHYLDNKEHYVKALGNRLTMIQSKYREERVALKSTGAGIKGDEDTGADNLPEHLKLKYTWWELADELWHAAPKCDTALVSNASSGASHGLATLAKSGSDDIVGSASAEEDTGGAGDGKNSNEETDDECTPDLEVDSTLAADYDSTSPPPLPSLFARRRTSILDSETSRSRSSTPGKVSKKGKAKSTLGRAPVADFAEIARNETKIGELTEKNRAARELRKIELQAENRKARLELKEKRATMKLELQHTKDTIAHQKDIKELENERLRLELQLLQARIQQKDL